MDRFSPMMRSALLNGVVTVTLSLLGSGALWYSIVERRLQSVEHRVDVHERELREVQRAAISQRDTVESIARDVAFVRGALSGTPPRKP